MLQKKKRKDVLDEFVETMKDVEESSEEVRESFKKSIKELEENELFKTIGIIESDELTSEEDNDTKNKKNKDVDITYLLSILQ